MGLQGLRMPRMPVRWLSMRLERLLGLRRLRWLLLVLGPLRLVLDRLQCGDRHRLLGQGRDSPSRPVAFGCLG
jgi:hypothetical protein